MDFTKAQKPRFNTLLCPRSLGDSSSSASFSLPPPLQSSPPRSQDPGPGKLVKKEITVPPKFVLAFHIAPDPGCAIWVLFRSELCCYKGRWPLGSPSTWGLDSPLALPQVNPSHFPQCKTKFHSQEEITESHDSVFTLPLSNVCAREASCPISRLGL